MFHWRKYSRTQVTEMRIQPIKHYNKSKTGLFAGTQCYGSKLRHFLRHDSYYLIEIWSYQEMPIQFYLSAKAGSSTLSLDCSAVKKIYHNWGANWKTSIVACLQRSDWYTCSCISESLQIVAFPRKHTSDWHKLQVLSCDRRSYHTEQ